MFDLNENELVGETISTWIVSHENSFKTLRQNATRNQPKDFSQYDAM